MKKTVQKFNAKNIGLIFCMMFSTQAFAVSKIDCVFGGDDTFAGEIDNAGRITNALYTSNYNDNGTVKQKFYESRESSRYYSTANGMITTDLTTYANGERTMQLSLPNHFLELGNAKLPASLKFVMDSFFVSDPTYNGTCEIN